MNRLFIGLAVFVVLVVAGYFGSDVTQSSSEFLMQEPVTQELVNQEPLTQERITQVVTSDNDRNAQTPAESSAATSAATTSTTEQSDDTASRERPAYTYYAEHGDSRQPALAQKKTPESVPSAEVLSSPVKYAEYEAKQNRSLISVYASVLQQLPTLRERVNRGAHDPSISAAEYQQAVEALEQLEVMRARLAIEQPQLLSNAQPQ
jgi:hypothetical protein